MRAKMSYLGKTSKLLSGVSCSMVFFLSDVCRLLKLSPGIKLLGGHAKHHDDYLKRYRETGVTHIIGSMRELQGRRKNGEQFPIVLGIEHMRDIDSDGPCDEDLLVAFVRDITQQKRATELEIEIRSAEELLHNMLPAEIAGRLKADPGHLADSHENVSNWHSVHFICKF